VRAWHAGSNCLVLLSVPDEPALLDWRDRAVAAGLPVATMVEPDIGDQHTAFAAGPTSDGLFTELPLQGREVAVT
jgi:hypothetical protein